MRKQRHHHHHTRSHAQRRPAIGIDIGRVIIAGDGPDTSFFGHDEDACLAAPAVPGAFEAIAELVAAFERRAYLVSKCGPKIQRRSLRWLDHHDFWATTGIARANVRFCLERRDKAEHAAKLALTHFVDDRWDVHTHLAGLVDHLYLFGPQPRRNQAGLAGLVLAPRWDDVLAHALPSLDSHAA